MSLFYLVIGALQMFFDDDDDVYSHEILFAELRIWKYLAEEIIATVLWWVAVVMLYYMKSHH